MKRFFMGLSVLMGIVGAGSAGIYYGRPYLTAALAPQAAVEEAPAQPEPSTEPIPLNAQPQIVAPGGNPFSRSATASNQSRNQDRYGNPAESPVVAGEARSDDIPDARSLELEVQDARSPQSVPAFRVNEAAAESQYVEQTAAVESDESAVPDDAATPTPAEPRRLEPADEEGRVSNRQPLVSRRFSGDAPTSEGPNDPEPQQTVDEPAQTPTDPDPADVPEGDQGTGRPGDPQLSGSQAPTLAIEKTAPAEIQIGQAAKFVIKVRNTGTVTAHGVEIHDVVPQGTQLVDTTPAATRGTAGELVWELGSLKPGDLQTVELQLMPMAEGEIGSVATVHFRAEASVRTVATKPLLNLEVFAPSKVMKGDEVTFKIKLSNPGSGAATNVVLSEVVPEGLKHGGGRELELEVGALKPGESRELELGLVADAAGPITNVVSAQGDANLRVEARTDLEVIAPQLQVSMAGPKRRYLERNATHNISVTNPGTAAAKDVELAATLPKELKFVEANNGGQYDPTTHSVYWSLEELPPQETGTVTLTTLPQQPGEARFTIKSTAQSGLADQHEEVLSIEGLAALNFQISDVNDPIEVGGITTYEVRITNQGTKSATNIHLVALVPKEMKAVSAEGPTRYKIDGQRVVFEALKQLAPKADTSFAIKVKALEAGDLRLQAQVSSDEIREPITKEESTRVFGDE